MERRVAAPLVLIISAIVVIGIRILGNYQFTETWQTVGLSWLSGSIIAWGLFRPTPVGGKGTGMIILGVIILIMAFGV